MNDLKKKILVEGLAHPAGLSMIAAGASMIFLGMIFGSFSLSVMGFLSTVLGVGIGITNLVCRFDSIKKNILTEQAKQIQMDRNRKLDDLEKRLTKDKDPRDQRYLREIRRLYNSLVWDTLRGKIDTIHIDTLLPRIEELFESCIKELEYSYRLWEMQRSVKGDAKRRLQEERDSVIASVGKIVDNFSEAVTAVMLLGVKRGQSPQEIAAKLDNDLVIAKRVDQRLAEIERGENPNFDEYLH